VSILSMNWSWSCLGSSDKICVLNVAHPIVI